MKTLFGLAAVVFCMTLPLSASADKVGGGDLNFTPKKAAPVLFSHEKHVKVKGLMCSACHHHTFQMEKGAYKMDMTKMTKGGFCGRCHNGELTFDVKDEKSCSRCHRTS